MDADTIGTIYGPFARPNGKYLLTIVRADGSRTSRSYETEAQALAEKAGALALLDRRDTLSIEASLTEYEAHMIAQGNKPKSVTETMRRLRIFWAPTDRLWMELRPRWGQERYDELAGVGWHPPLPAPLSADSHRNYLAEAKTFGRWALERRYCEASPVEAVKGVGKRRHGKKQLRIDELRVWLNHAQLRAATEPGALAALMTVTMGLRASEIVQRVVRDVDDGGRVLWVTDDAEGQGLKTAAARRRVDIPDWLRPYFAKHTDGKAAADWIFPGRYDHGGRYKTGHVDRNQVRKWVHRICVLAGVPAVSAQAMRGSYATLGMLKQVHELAESMGHENVAVTRRSYATKEAVEKAVQANVLRVLTGGKK